MHIFFQILEYCDTAAGVATVACVVIVDDDHELHDWLHFTGAVSSRILL